MTHKTKRSNLSYFSFSYLWVISFTVAPKKKSRLKMLTVPTDADMPNAKDMDIWCRSIEPHIAINDECKIPYGF